MDKEEEAREDTPSPELPPEMTAEQRRADWEAKLKKEREMRVMQLLKEEEWEATLIDSLPEEESSVVKTGTADQLKEAANAAYVAGDYEKALVIYKVAIRERSPAEEMEAALWNNGGMALLKMVRNN